MPEPREDLGRYMARTEGRQDSQAEMDQKDQKFSGSRIWGQVSHLGSLENLEKVQSIRDQSTTELYSGGCSSSDWSFEEPKQEPKQERRRAKEDEGQILNLVWVLPHTSIDQMSAR